MFFIGMMSIKEDIRAAYAAPKIETTEVRLETGIAQSLPSAGDYEEGGANCSPGSRTDVQFKNDFRGEESMKRQLLFLAAGAVVLVGLLGANSIVVLIACALVGLAASKLKIGGMKL